MKDFKIRASKGSVLLTAKGVMSKAETPKTYVKEWLISEITGKTKSIESKYFRRGKESEDLAIARLSKHLGIDLVKNEVFFTDEYFTGTPDVLTGDCVYDTKCSFDVFTFPYFMNEPPINYVAQLQIYMHLTGRRKASLVYCLENGTEEQINKYAWALTRAEGLEEPTIEIWDEAEAELNYDYFDDHLRIKIFEIDYDEKMIEELIKGVDYWSEYIKTDLLPKL